MTPTHLALHGALVLLASFVAGLLLHRAHRLGLSGRDRPVQKPTTRPPPTRMMLIP